MKILVFGFGGIGLRHVQSLIKEDGMEIIIIEKNDRVIEKNFKTLSNENYNLEKIQFYNELRKIKGIEIDVVIHATNADVRLDTFKQIIELVSIRYILLEKVCFQSENQIKEALVLLNNKQIEAFVHLPMRYYLSLKFLQNQKKYFEGSTELTIQGGNWGILCNLIHYLDFFQLLGFQDLNSELKDINYNAKLVNSKRGEKYQEIFGDLELIWKNIRIKLHDHERYCSKFEIKLSNQVIIKNEGIFNEEKLIYDGFRQFTSELTYLIIKDIINQKSKLPTLTETIYLHRIVFDLYRTISGKNEHICPIT